MEEDDEYIYEVIDGETVCPQCGMEFEDEVCEHYCRDNKEFIPCWKEGATDE